MWKVCDSRMLGEPPLPPLRGNVATFQTENLILLSLSQASTLSIVKSQKSLGLKKIKVSFTRGSLFGLLIVVFPIPMQCLKHSRLSIIF